MSYVQATPFPGLTYNPYPARKLSTVLQMTLYFANGNNIICLTCSTYISVKFKTKVCEWSKSFLYNSYC